MFKSIQDELVEEVKQLSITLQECERLITELQKENENLKSCLTNYEKKDNKMPDLSLIRGDLQQDRIGYNNSTELEYDVSRLLSFIIQPHGGGTGLHKGFKIPRHTSCGFESRP